MGQPAGVDGPQTPNNVEVMLAVMYEQGTEVYTLMREFQATAEEVWSTLERLGTQLRVPTREDIESNMLSICYHLVGRYGSIKSYQHKVLRGDPWHSPGDQQNRSPLELTIEAGALDP